MGNRSVSEEMENKVRETPKESLDTYFHSLVYLLRKENRNSTMRLLNIFLIKEKLLMNKS